MLAVKVTIVEAQGVNLPADAGPDGHLRCGVVVLPHSTTAPPADAVHTKPLPAGGATKWDEALDVEAESQDKLAFECWLTTAEGKDTLVGRVEMAVSSLVVGSSSDKWLALKAPETAKPAGLLHALIHPRTKRTLSKRASSSVSNDSNKIRSGSSTPKGPTFEPSDLEKWLSAEEFAALDEKERSRQKAILEVIETERSYMNDLDILQRIFIKPIHDNNYLTKSEMNSVFSNVETLRDINMELMKELDELQSKRVAIKSLGEVFAKRDSMFKLYAIFCSAIVDVNQRVEQFKEKNPPFATFLEKCFVNPECRLLPLDSFVHAPLARLLKYPLLLDAVIKYTPSDHPDREPLVKVYDNLMEIVNMVNERTRQVENVQRLIKLQKTIANSDEPGNDFVDNQRFLVKEGLLTRFKGEGKNKKEHKLHLILFNDMLVLTKPLTSKQGPSFRVIKKIPTKDIQIGDSAPSTSTPSSLSVTASSGTIERTLSSDSDSAQKKSPKEPATQSATGSGLKGWRSTMRVNSPKTATGPEPELRIDLHCHSLLVHQKDSKDGKDHNKLTFVAVTPEERAEWKKALHTAVSVSTREQTFSFKTASARTRDGESSASASASASTISSVFTPGRDTAGSATAKRPTDPSEGGSGGAVGAATPSPGSAEPPSASTPAPAAAAAAATEEQKKEKKGKKEKKEKKEKKTKKKGSSRREKSATKKLAKKSEDEAEAKDKIEKKNKKKADDVDEGAQNGGGVEQQQEEAKSPGPVPRKSKSEVYLKQSAEDVIDPSAKKLAHEQESKAAEQASSTETEQTAKGHSEQRKSRRKSLMSFLRRDDIAEAFVAEEQADASKKEASDPKEKEGKKKKTFGGTWGRKKKASATANADAIEPTDVPSKDGTSEGKTKKKG